MPSSRTHLVVLAVVLAILSRTSLSRAQTVVPLPGSAKVTWDTDKAWHEATSSRERICLNGLWRWQPADAAAEKPPVEQWGFFKVPGCWPGRNDWLQKDCQTIYVDPAWHNQPLSGVKAAWYQREITIPNDWTGRRIAISAESLNSFATIYLDGTKAGEMRFPGGEVDITSLCRAGQKHLLSMLVIALPLKSVMASYSDTSAVKQVQGTVERRGLCGDVFLVSTPAEASLTEVKVDTSVRKWEITIGAGIRDARPDATYALQAQVLDDGRQIQQFTSNTFKSADIADGRFAFSSAWKPEKLWDLHTAQNMYELRLSLVDQSGKVLDSLAPVRFGFREFWIDGRDFRLNGSRIYLSAVPLDNAQISAGMATYQSTRESLQRLKSFGINFVYTHNYGCEPGTHLSFAEVLRAADDEGMLVAFSQPHFGQYDWKAPDADQNNGYARHAEFYVRAAQNHPSVVMYAMSHNACGTPDDANPDHIDGIQDNRSPWAADAAKRALRAEAIVHRLDGSRIVYHHSGGNLGSVYTDNFYANFAPVQEMSDWFEHWSTAGVKPLFLCEYGVPITWDWSMYRGWYDGKRTFGDANVPWELCLAEWNSQFFGDAAFQISDKEKAAVRLEATKFHAGSVWHRWDYPGDAMSTPDFEQRQAIFAKYLTDNLRAFRTLGVSAFCPWDHGQFWKLRDGVSRARKPLSVDWDHLQRPGFSPDYLEGQMEWINTSFERSDWIPTSAAQALIRNNGPLLAYIAGDASHVTGKDHNYLPGQNLQKQIIVINNSRQTITCDCAWSLALPKALGGTRRITVQTGEQERIPVDMSLPADLPAGTFDLTLQVTFDNGQIQRDSFTICIIREEPPLQSGSRVALFDPDGQSAQALDAMDLKYQRLDAESDLSGVDTLIIGKGALKIDGPDLNIDRVRDGMKVIVFEQTAEVLEKRIGFRVQEYGLRQVFKRVPDHPVLAGLTEESLRDWRGAATLLPPRLKYQSTSLFNYAPVVKWCDIPVTRLWRCGNSGNVASVLIEKPGRGDFLPLLDGGFSLQYSPLLEYREGKGMILFCQLDVTGRTENDPAARRVVRNIIEYVSDWKPAPQRGVLYAGDPEGRAYFQKTGVEVTDYRGGALSRDRVLVVGPHGGQELADNATAIRDFVNANGHVLAIGLDESEANAFLPMKASTRTGEHIGCYFDQFGRDSLLAGVGPADVYDRDPRNMPLLAGGVQVIGDGVLAQAGHSIVFCQLVPWEFDSGKRDNVRRTYRRIAFAVTRILANMGVAAPTPILDRFRSPVAAPSPEKRWLDGLYIDQPVEWDDPYRYFCW